MPDRRDAAGNPACPGGPRCSRPRPATLLCKLMRSEAAHDADPLRSGRACNLLLEHPHRVGKRSHAIPAQLHVVVEPAADDVHVAVDETGNDAAPLEVDASRTGTGQTHDILLGPRCNETVATNGDRLRLRILPVERGDPA